MRNWWSLELMQPSQCAASAKNAVAANKLLHWPLGDSAHVALSPFVQ
jgi:hypothetical protein